MPEIDVHLVAEIIHRHFREAGYEVSVNPDSILPESLLGLIHFTTAEENPFAILLETLCANHRGKRELLYHFRRPEIAELILRGRSVQINQLSWQKDGQEFIEFFERSDLWTKKDGFSSLPTDADGVSVSVQAPIQVREQVFALSLSKAISDEHFKRFGDVCLALEIIDRPADEAKGQRHYELRDIYYDAGDTFTFIEKMQAELLEKVGAVLNLSRVPALAALTKRQKDFGANMDFEAETEVRLILDAAFARASYGESISLGTQSVEVTDDSSRVYIDRSLVPLPFLLEKYFHIRLRGVIFHDGLDPMIRKHITELVHQNFPNAFVADDEESGRVEMSKYVFTDDVEADPDEEWQNELGLRTDDESNSISGQ